MCGFLLTKVLAVDTDSEGELGAARNKYSRPGMPLERANVGLIVSER